MGSQRYSQFSGKVGEGFSEEMTFKVGFNGCTVKFQVDGRESF